MIVTSFIRAYRCYAQQTKSVFDDIDVNEFDVNGFTRLDEFSNERCIA